MIEQLQTYFQYPFVKYAFIVGTLIALCSSLLGVTLVLKRYSFIGDGLSHVAFGAMAIGSVLHLTSNNLITMPVTIGAAILLLMGNESRKIKGDAAIALISVSSLALGYMLMNIFSSSANVSGDVCTTLFGSTSILTIQIKEVWFTIALSAVVILVFIIFYNRIFGVTFDENFAKATGIKTQFYNLLIAIIIAIIIVLGMNLVGSLLISALVIFPALSAMRVIHNFKGVVILSTCLSVFCAISGLLISILASTPVGATIVAMDMLMFFVCCAVGALKK
jgi:zinc transport system permease protein